MGLESAALAARRLALGDTMARYRERPYDMMRECFVSYDPKGKVKVARPWMHTDEHQEICEAIFEAVRTNHVDEIDIYKSRQTYLSWTFSGVNAALMATTEGFRGAVQSRKDEVSWDIGKRVAYILQNMRGPLKGILDPRDLAVSREEVHLKRFAGRDLGAIFTPLPQGGDQWRYMALTLGGLDEMAYNREGRSAHAAAKAACEGGGVLMCFSTPKVGSHFNRVIQEGLDRYHQHDRVELEARMS